MDRRELQAKRAETAAAARAIVDKADAEKRAMTADEEKIFDGHMTRADALAVDITRCEKLEAAEAAVKAVQPRRVEPAPGDREFAVPRRTLRCFRGPDAEERAHRVGMWFVGLVAPDGSPLQARARRFCRDKGMEYRTAAAEGTDSLGGFIVPPDFSTEIISMAEEYGVWRRECRIRKMTRDTQQIPRRAGGCGKIGRAHV